MIISSPSIVFRWNQCRGHVGICDWLLEACRAFFRTKKWTVNVTVRLVSVNAHLKYREGCKKNQVKKENFGFTWISSGQRRCCLLFRRVEDANCQDMNNEQY